MGSRGDTLNVMTQLQAEKEQAIRQMERLRATDVINAYCDEKGWSDEDRAMVIGALGLDQPMDTRLSRHPGLPTVNGHR